MRRWRGPTRRFWRRLEDLFEIVLTILVGACFLLLSALFIYILVSRGAS
jgi:RsiW-degrading membrane proteinase PrsW (M82 family)